MTAFDPPAFRADARPEFTDASGCAAWLRELPLANVPLAHGRLLDQIEELNGCKVPPAERLKMLELLSEPIEFAQTELAKKFLYRPAQLPRPEREIFQRAIGLWDALANGYRHCLYAAATGAMEMSEPLLCQRVLRYCEQRMLCHDGIYQEIPGDVWSLAHQVFAFAEARGISTAELPGEKRKKTSCTQIYAHMLLLQLANPNELTQREMSLISRWLDRWSSRVVIGHIPSEANDGVAPLAVDFSQSTGAKRGLAPGNSIRYLDIDRPVQSVRKRIHRLRRGELPAALGLGDEVSKETAERLLTLLYRRWRKDEQARQQPRRGASGTALAVSSLAAMHYFITGNPFHQPHRPQATAKITSAQREEIATFGRIATRREEDYAAAHGYALETWQIADESLSGLRLRRIDPAANSRLLLKQLLAVRPADAKNFLLAQIRWLSVSSGFDLSLGVRTLPGVPAGIAIRASGINTRQDEYIPALMLPAVMALQSPDTVVLPPGWFRPKRVIEIYSGSAREIMLMETVMRGADFEQVTFASA